MISDKTGTKKHDTGYIFILAALITGMIIFCGVYISYQIHRTYTLKDITGYMPDQTARVVMYDKNGKGTYTYYDEDARNIIDRYNVSYKTGDGTSGAAQETVTAFDTYGHMLFNIEKSGSAVKVHRVNELTADEYRMA